jgi:hypothetical protein
MSNLELPIARALPSIRAEAARRQLEAFVGDTHSNVRLRWRPGLTATFIALAMVGGSFAAAAIITKGPVPISSTGSLEINKAPTFVSVTSGGKVVGYIPRTDIEPVKPGEPIPNGLGGIKPVYGSNLRTVVGHMYPGIGFVALGAIPSTSCTSVTTIVANGPPPTPCTGAEITVPDVVGMSTPSAAAKLSRLGFTINIINVGSTVVPRGEVVTMSPAPGSSLDQRAVVTIDNSADPATRGEG